MKYLVSGLALAVGLTTSAEATVFMTTQQGFLQPDWNVLLQDGDTAGIGGTLVADTNGQGPQDSVGFSSSTDAIIAPSQGQARIEAQGEAQGNYLDQISVFPLLSNTGFDEVELNITALSTGLVTFVATTQLGVETFQNVPVSNGENKFIFYTDPLQTILNLSMASTVGIVIGFNDVKQFRISFENIPPVPLPGALLLMGSVLAGTAGMAKWRARRSGISLA